MTDIIRHGTDSSGRKILVTPFMQRVWAQILAHPSVKPFANEVTIVQGAWMAQAGGGAAASAGVHDGGGCLDIRTWNLTTSQVDTFIRVARLHGFAMWRRDSRHGMDPHMHGVLGSDAGLSSGARAQWAQYLAGRDGLARNGADYEWRPQPLVTRPPPQGDWFDMATEADLRNIVRDEIEKALTRPRLTITGAGGKVHKPSLATAIKWIDVRTRRIERKVAK